MSWAEVGQIAVASIASAGDIGAIMIAVVSFATKRVVDRMDKKFQSTLEQKLEKYKTQLDRGNYISPTTKSRMNTTAPSSPQRKHLPALKKHIQNYVFTDGYAEKSVERRFAEDLDAADEVCVYAKLPRGFHIRTPVGSYSPEWAIAFNEGTVKHIFFIAETKGTMERLSLKPIEEAKISCARKLFNAISTENVKYHDVDSYQHLLDVMKSL